MFKTLCQNLDFQSFEANIFKKFSSQFETFDDLKLFQTHNNIISYLFFHYSSIHQLVAPHYTQYKKFTWWKQRFIVKDIWIFFLHYFLYISFLNFLKLTLPVHLYRKFHSNWTIILWILITFGMLSLLWSVMLMTECWRILPGVLLAIKSGFTKSW